MKCEACGGEVRIGDWPFCKGNPSAHVPAPNFGEEPLEPYEDEHLTHEPGGVEITTRGQRRQMMREQHLEYHKLPKAPGSTLYFDMSRR